MMKQNFVLVGVLIAVGICLIVSQGATAQNDNAADEVVAKVYGEEITKSELVAELLDRYGYGVLQSMIEARAIEHYAKENGFKVSDEEIDKRLAEAKSQIDKQATLTGVNFDLWLAQRRLTLAAFREQLRLQALLELMVKDKVKVEDQEVAQYYQQNREKLAREEAMQAAHIVVATREEAENLRNRILKGEISWEDAAKQYSLDPYGRDNGGLLGWVVRGDSPSQKAVFALQHDGDISPVTQTQMGYHIFKRLSHQPGGIPPFEDVQDEIRQHIYQAKLLRAMQAQREYIVKMGDPQRFIHFASEGTETTPAQ